MPNIAMYDLFYRQHLHQLHIRLIIVQQKGYIEMQPQISDPEVHQHIKYTDLIHKYACIEYIDRMFLFGDYNTGFR